MIAIIDYKVGNVQAIFNIYKRLGIEAVIASDPVEISRADRLILPGVGAFDWAMKRLTQAGIRRALDEAVVEARKPLLGICVGMQMLAQRSEEGSEPGLGWVGGSVRRFEAHRSSAMALPHMGWNDVAVCGSSPLFAQLESGAQFYFLHSYYFHTAHEEFVMSTTDYYGTFASGVTSENIFGVQFHPEKSHHWGVQLLANFAQL